MKGRIQDNNAALHYYGYAVNPGIPFFRYTILTMLIW